MNLPIPAPDWINSRVRLKSKQPTRVRIAGGLSAMLWIGVLSFGRLIAYL